MTQTIIVTKTCSIAGLAIVIIWLITAPVEKWIKSYNSSLTRKIPADS